MILLGLLGNPGTGRDRIAKHLVTAHNWAQYRMSGPAREMLELLGLVPEQFEPGPRGVPVFGDCSPALLEVSLMHWGATEWSDIWRALASQHIRTIAPLGYPGLVISDCTDADADWIRANGGTVLHTESIDVNAGIPTINVTHQLDDEFIVLSNPGQDVGPLVDNILPDLLARYVVKPATKEAA